MRNLRLLQFFSPQFIPFSQTANTIRGCVQFVRAGSGLESPKIGFDFPQHVFRLNDRRFKRRRLEFGNQLTFFDHAAVFDQNPLDDAGDRDMYLHDVARSHLEVAASRTLDWNNEEQHRETQ